MPQKKSEKKVAILQSNYIPWKGYFDIINRADIFVVYDEVQYTKNDWRNRNKIKTPNGLSWLTIPVRQEKLSQKIYETFISQENWNVKHWKTIRANYFKAPYFNNFEQIFEEFYLNLKTKNLSEINIAFIRKICEIIDVRTEISDSRQLGLTGDKNERLIDAVKKLGGGHYISGPSAKNYIDEAFFKANNVQVEWMNYSNYPVYQQMFSPFEHCVSILDLLFNTGNDAKIYLTNNLEV